MIIRPVARSRDRGRATVMAPSQSFRGWVCSVAAAQTSSYWWHVYEIAPRGVLLLHMMDGGGRGRAEVVLLATLAAVKTRTLQSTFRFSPSSAEPFRGLLGELRSSSSFPSSSSSSCQVKKDSRVRICVANSFSRPMLGLFLKSATQGYCVLWFGSIFAFGLPRVCVALILRSHTQ